MCSEVLELIGEELGTAPSKQVSNSVETQEISFKNSHKTKYMSNDDDFQLETIKGYFMTR